ncbi:MAG: glycosyltransferase [Caulobacteraceae bacterium]
MDLKRIQSTPLPEGFTLLQIVPRLDAGGVEQASLDLARAVAAAGGRSVMASGGGALEGAFEEAGAKLVRAPLQAKDPASLAANALRLARAVRRQRVSLIHVRSRAPAFSALAAARLTGIPLVTTYHGAYSASWFAKRWYNRIMTAGDAVIANSHFTAGHIAREHPGVSARLAIVPEAIDCERFDPAAVSGGRIQAVRAAWGLEAGDRRRVLLIAARLVVGKGQALALDALARTPSRSRVLLVLAGEAGRPAFVRKLEADAARLGLADQIRLVGPCRDMPAAMAVADLVLAPSLGAESFGRSVVEAAAMATPVLASATGGHAETVVDGSSGWLVAPGEAAAWSEAIERAIAVGPQELAAMGRAARERAKRLYSLPAMCEATFAVYRRVLEGRA